MDAYDRRTNLGKNNIFDIIAEDENFSDHPHMCAVSLVVHTSNISSCQKKNYFSFPVAVNNSIKVGPLVFLL